MRADSSFESRKSIISINKSGTIISCNNAARSLFGYAIGSLIGRNVSELMPSPHSKLHASYVERYIETRRSQGGIGEWKGMV